MNYKTYIGFFLCSCFLSLVLTPLIRLFAIRFGVIDIPDARKIHTDPIPRLGGVALFLAFTIPWGVLYFFSNRITEVFVDYETIVGAFLVAVCFVVLLGVYDDFKGANATKKFIVQILLGLWLFLLGYRIDQVTHPFGGEAYVLSDLESSIVSILWIVGITNAINLIDGINGLATGIAAGLALTLAVINILGDNIVVALMTTSLAGSCMGFLPYNFPRAKIFLGDSGSLFLGLALAAISMISFFKAATVTFMFTPIILFGLPILDTGSTVLRRYLKGVPIFQADKEHFHHKLIDLGLTQKQTTFVLYSISSLFGLLAVSLSLRNTPRLALTLIFLGVVCFTFFFMHHGTKKK